MADVGSKKFVEEIKKPLEADGYEVQKALGKGAFGEVFLASKGNVLYDAASKSYAIKSICKQLVKKRPFLEKYIKQ
jgi:serine/threonine protein kinase